MSTKRWCRARRSNWRYRWRRNWGQTDGSAGRGTGERWRGSQRGDGTLAQQLVQAQRASLLGIGERLAVGARQRHDVAVELRLADGDPVDALQAHARTADLLIASQRDPAGAGGLSTGRAARLLVGAACPVLTVPHIGWGTAGLVPFQSRTFGRALVAWSDTRESARAARRLAAARACNPGAGGISIALQTLGATWLDFGARGRHCAGLLHRVTAIATGGLDALPHNGVVITLLGICGPTHRQSYLDIFVVTVAAPLLALAAVVVPGTAFRSS